MTPTFYITHLYPEQMSIYGDMGNIIALQYFLKNYGFQVAYQTVAPGQPLPEKTDFYFIGGGQDKEQLEICQDLQTKKQKLISDIEDGVCLLSICGGYQLLGKKFLTGTGEQIPGIGLFDVTTQAPDSSVKSRCIGNIIVRCTLPGMEDVLLVGFENHSGQTYFTSPTSCRPLGDVVVGFGNNSVEKLEGCVYKNAIGCYLHGSCLPKNPELTIYLLNKCIERKRDKSQITPQFLQQLKGKGINTEIAMKTKQNLIQRFIPKNQYA